MKRPPRSPWLHQLKRARPMRALERDATGNVAIVGGGIAGAVTAYFILRYTKFSVLLAEADKVAHGATGHNAGQITSYFERPLASLVEEFGLELTAKGQAAIESGWELLEEIRRDAKLQTPVWRFTGYAGCTNIEQVLLHLRDNAIKFSGGLLAERVYISAEHIKGDALPEELRHLCQFVPHEYILSLLETKNPAYIGALCYDKGCINSALFTEEVVAYLTVRHPQRFSVYEMTPVRTVELSGTNARLHTDAHLIHAKHVVLCTNGFENITIQNNAGENIDTGFHHLVEGRVGYMAGFLEPMDKPPTAVSYYTEIGANPEDPYFYLTRRPYDLDGKTAQNLLSVGGPDRPWEETVAYDRQHPYKEEELEKIETFLKDTYQYYSPLREKELFLWHGLMGYTTSRVRLIGAEPRNPLLMYNLGCNGVGILPSLYGGKRIADILKGEPLGKTIFDPQGPPHAEAA